MKKKTTIIIAAIALITVLCSCEPNDYCGRVNTENQPIEEKDYQVTFLFEIDSIRVYRFRDNGTAVYFTNANGKTQYDYTTHHTYRSGKVTHHRTVTHHEESINTRED